MSCVWPLLLPAISVNIANHSAEFAKRRGQPALFPQASFRPPEMSLEKVEEILGIS
jgi:hypothetical protein